MLWRMDEAQISLPPDVLRLAAMLTAGGLCTDLLDEVLHDYDCWVSAPDSDDRAILTKLYALVDSLGLAKVLAVFEDMEFNASLGPYILAKEGADEFWCHDYGWTSDRLCANGFKASEVVSTAVRFENTLNGWFWYVPSRQGSSVDREGPFACLEDAAEAAIAKYGFRKHPNFRSTRYARFRLENSISA